MPFYTPIGSTPVPRQPTPANVATTSKETTSQNQQPSATSPRASSSGSRTSAGQSSTADRSWGDSTLGSSQANAIVLSPSASPAALQGIEPERAASPFNLLNELDKVADDGRPSHAKGGPPSVGSAPGGNASSSRSANSPDMPTTQQIIAEHTTRSSAATSQRPRASQGPSSSQAAHRSSDTSVRRAAQSPATSQRPGAVDHHSQERAKQGSLSNQSHGLMTAVPQRVQASNVNSPSSSSSALTSAQQASDDSGDEPADASSSSKILTTPRGDALWTAADQDLLRGIMQQGAMSWNKVHSLYNASSSQPRSMDAMRKHWYKLAGRQADSDRSPQTTVVAQAVAGASGAGPSRGGASRGRNLWQEDEDEILRQGLADDKSIKEVICDYALRFPGSKRTAMAVETRYREMLKAVAAREGGEDDVEDENDEEEESDGESEGTGSDDDDNSEAAPTTSGAAPQRIPWSKRDDALLVETALRNRTHCVHWAQTVEQFNSRSDVQRSRPAIEWRWHNFVKDNPSLLQQRPQRSSAPKAGPSTPSASTSVQLSRKRKRTASDYHRPRWTSPEMRVLRASLAKHPDEASHVSFPAVLQEFYEALPHSTRTDGALRTKWLRLVERAGEPDGEEGDDDGAEDGEDGADKEGDATMGETSMRTRSGRTLQPLDEQASPSNGTQTSAPRTQTSRDAVVAAVNRQLAKQCPSHPPATPAATQQIQGASCFMAPPAAAAQPIITTTQPYPTVSWAPDGVRIQGCVSGLDIVIFSPGSGTIYPRASAAPEPTFDQPPLFYLRCREDAEVVPVTLPQGASIRTKMVPRVGAGAGGDGGGGGGEMAMQTSFVAANYQVVLLF